MCIEAGKGLRATAPGGSAPLAQRRPSRRPLPGALATRHRPPYRVEALLAGDRIDRSLWTGRSGGAEA